MTSIAQRISRALSSPQGRKLVERARREAAKPSTQQKLRQLVQRMTGRPTRGR